MEIMENEKADGAQTPQIKGEKSPNLAVNELIAFLTPLADGELVPEFNNQLHALVKAVRDTGKGGSISLNIKIAPWNGNISKLIVTTEINDKTPKLTQQPSIYFSDEDGGLHRNDPAQTTFKFDK